MHQALHYIYYDIACETPFPLPFASSTQKTKTSTVPIASLSSHRILFMLTINRGQSSLPSILSIVYHFWVCRPIMTHPFTLPVVLCSIISEQQTKRYDCWACFSLKKNMSCELVDCDRIICTISVETCNILSVKWEVSTIKNVSLFLLHFLPWPSSVSNFLTKKWKRSRWFTWP